MNFMQNLKLMNWSQKRIIAIIVIQVSYSFVFLRCTVLCFVCLGSYVLDIILLVTITPTNCFLEAHEIVELLNTKNPSSEEISVIVVQYFIKISIENTRTLVKTHTHYDSHGFEVLLKHSKFGVIILRQFSLWSDKGALGCVTDTNCCGCFLWLKKKQDRPIYNSLILLVSH